MRIWALADLHLALSVPEKSMEVFGSSWKEYVKRIEENWSRQVGKGDLVLLPGDISWASHLDEALIDLRWIDQLAGTKVILKGNHDYWWPSNKQLRERLPPSIQFVHNTVFNWNGVSVGGTRLWDSDEYSFEPIIEEVKSSLVGKKREENSFGQEQQNMKIFERELNRLEISLKQLDQKARLRIAMTHYPPIGLDLEDSRASRILEKHRVDICVFGHLHNVKMGGSIFGRKNQILYLLVSADYLNFSPLNLG